jgi:hypothetical protein
MHAASRLAVQPSVVNRFTLAEGVSVRRALSSGKIQKTYWCATTWLALALRDRSQKIGNRPFEHETRRHYASSRARARDQS